MRQYKTLLLQGALKSEADITIHTGSWTHDVDQASIVVYASEKKAEDRLKKKEKNKDEDASGEQSQTRARPFRQRRTR